VEGQEKFLAELTNEKAHVTVLKTPLDILATEW
jgi:hypothetical protein